MLYQKTGYPAESDLVECTVTRVQHNSVFVKLNHYQNASAMLHISEVSPGRIRNLREFVVEGKVIVCKVLSINPVKGHIDVSLRRVPENQRAQFVTSLKQESKAEKILEQFCKEQKLELVKVYNTLKAILAKEGIEFIFTAFNNLVLGTYAFENSGLEPDKHAALHAFIRQRIKPPQVEILGQFKIITFLDNGVDVLRETLVKAAAVDTKQMKLLYGGGGLYNIRIICDDFKSAEKILKDVVDIIEDRFKNDKNAVYEFTRSEGKQLA
ncbi:MAG TPA: hypothetical protein VK158_05100 [Acidobacteriota bacterium]|nr:hypothetical protein [Acidobacteriota bacterium]